MDLALEADSNSIWITDLKAIAKKSQEHFESNQRFAEFLKTENTEKVDAVVVELSQNAAKNIDCTKCANCCKSLTVAANYQDTAKVAAAVNLEIHDFKAKYMKRDFEGDMVFKQRPCPFLKSNLCSVYENRPSTCRTYPHLEKGQFISRLGNVLSNLSVCPIAFNTFELLKLNYE